MDPGRVFIDPLGLNHSERMRLWRRVIKVMESYLHTLPSVPASPVAHDGSMTTLVRRYDLLKPMDPQQVLELAVDGLWDQAHAAHPQHFGLFMPRPTAMGVIAETLVAAFNPQAGSCHHSPFAVAVEAHVLRTLGAWFGYDRADVDGTITTGGAEANHTAVLTALEYRFPGFAQEGLWALSKHPAIYLSEEGHRSFHKAARACGLGNHAVRLVATDSAGRIDVQTLEDCIARDRLAGWEPVMIVATAGTTAAGAVDPIAALANLAEREGIWLHVDGAWGAAAAWLTELAPLFDGLARADSITFDPHKWLSVPLGVGTFLTRHGGVLERLFSVEAPYLPELDEHPDAEPYAHSLQWSRRFSGLKVFLSLLVAGRQGYEQSMRRQLALGDLLRRELLKTGWTVRSRSLLPVVCFDDAPYDGKATLSHVQALVRRTVSSSQAWVCAVRTVGCPVVRACISNYVTTEHDVLALVRTLAKARRGVALPPSGAAASE